MRSWLRITLLAACTAMGIAVALAVAVHKRPPLGAKSSDAPPAASSAIIRPAPAVPLAAAAADVSPQAPFTVAQLKPVEAPYRDPVARQVGQLEESIQHLEESTQRRERSLLKAIAAIQDQIDDSQRRPFAAQPTAAQIEQAPIAEATEQPVVAAQTRVPEMPPDVRRGEGGDHLSINVQNSDLRTVLEMISRETGLNIIASKGVTGTVTANLNGVDLETALAAILKATGFVAAREGSIVFIGTPADLALMNQFQDRINTRIYRPNYVRAADLQVMFTPLMSTDGKITVSSPAQIDIPADQVKTGGNGFAGAEAVIVRDYETILAQLDEIYAEVDVKPKQVAIEAMILSVDLNDTFKFGVNFDLLRDKSNVRLVTGLPPAGLGSIDLGDGGLHFGFLDASLGSFIDCLESVGDTNVIASPRLTCLNKQRAEIQIGEELGYVSTTVTESSSTQTINFLSVGTLLRIRPFIGNDGLIRLEVHPELSTGSVTIEQNMSLPQKEVTQVTTNVLCPDACTVVIGGLIREDLTMNTKQIPVLGNVPYIGWLFRTKNNTVKREEIIVLITPRIVSEPFMCHEGTKYGNEFTQRQSIYFNKMSPIAKRNLGLHHLRLARAAYNAGDQMAAMKQVNLAIHYDPQSRDAVVLRNEVVAAGGFEDESIHEYLHRGLSPLVPAHRDYSRFGYPWKEFEGFGPLEPSGTGDLGSVGPTRTILRPSPRPGNLFDPGGPPALGGAPEPIPTPHLPGGLER